MVTESTLNLWQEKLCSWKYLCTLNEGEMQKGQGGLEIIVPFQEAKGCSANPALPGCVQHWNPAVLAPPSPHQNPAHKGVFLA